MPENNEVRSKEISPIFSRSYVGSTNFHVVHLLQARLVQLGHPVKPDLIKRHVLILEKRLVAHACQVSRNRGNRFFLNAAATSSHVSF